MEQKVFCYNCGNYGHIFKNCHYPIISLGIICYYEIDGKYKFILIRRKDTLGYTDFIRGKYVFDKDNILTLLNTMTVTEKENLLKYDLKILWDNLWTINKNKHMNEFEKSVKKFEYIKNTGIGEKEGGCEKEGGGQKIGGCEKEGGCQKIGGSENMLKLSDIIKMSNTIYSEPEWGFPKGKREKDETNLESAIREFEEETNLKTAEYKLLNLKPVIENYIGSNGKKYRHIYYVARLLDKPKLSVSNENMYQQTEISSIKLLDYKHIVKKIRPYHNEKIKVLESVIESLQYLTEHNIPI